MQEQDLAPIISRLRLQHSDDELVEAKACAEQLSKDIWETVSAFANTAGGLILLGIDEESDFKPVKRFAIDKVLDQFVSGMGDGDPHYSRIQRAPAYHPHRFFFEGSPILAIEIEELELDKKPCYIEGRGIVGGSYKRIDDKDVRLSPTEIYSFENFLKPSYADRQPVASATIDDLQPQIVDGLLEREKHSRALRGANTRESKLSRLNITNENGEVCLAGLLVCGDYPQQFYPKLLVDVAVHPGVNKADPTASTRFLDRAICEGPIGEVIDTAYHAITRNLRTYSVIKGAGRVDELEIPEEVLREALANAIVHREYGEYFQGQGIAVDIYPDRLEITNPGGLWGGKTLENIGDGTSVCRNAALMKLMSMTPLPGGNGVPTEGNGSGVPLMKSAMASRALAEPKFIASIDSFKVVLGRSGTEIDENRQWLSERVSHDLDSHEQAVAVILRRDGRATVASIREQLGIDSDEIRKVFKGLVADGLLKWAATDEVELVRQPRWSQEEWFDRILATLDTEHPMSIHELSSALNRRAESTRNYVKALVERGDVIATAPPSSKDRKYLLRSEMANGDRDGSRN